VLIATLVLTMFKLLAKL